MDRVIIYGALRSGSTMLRLMLDGHSQLSCTGEHDFLFDYIRHDGQTSVYDVEALSRDRIFRAQSLELPPSAAVDVAFPHFLAQIRQAPVSCLMLHRNIDLARSLLPDTPVVHLLRDPRDVARSYVGMGWHGSVYCAAEGWRAVEAGWDAVTGRCTAPVMELRYEQLVARPQAELARICAFCGTVFEEAMLGYPVYTTYDAPDARLANQWRRKMTPRDQRLVEARVGALLPARGYVPSGQPALQVTPAQRALLQVSDKLGRHQHDLKRYGVHHIKRVAGARFGIPSIERAAQRRIDEIMTERYLR